MTQQYIVGEFSALISSLEIVCAQSLAGAVQDLRHRVESAPADALAHLASEAAALADMICLTALEMGDPAAFARHADAAASLHEFAVSANLLV